MYDTRLHVNPTGELLEATRAKEAEVFHHWFGNTRDQLDEEYAPYEDFSVFLAVTDHLGDVMAQARLIAPGSPAGLKTLNDIQEKPWEIDGHRSAAAAGLDLKTTWEIATIGSTRRASFNQIRYALAIYRGFGLIAEMNGMTGYVAILDNRVRAQLSMLGVEHYTLPGTHAAPYLGSAASTPVYTIGAQLAAYQRKHHPETYALLAHGHGLDGVQVPPKEEFLLFGRTEAPAESWLTPHGLGTATTSPVPTQESLTT
jgi:hypothetical protein